MYKLWRWHSVTVIGAGNIVAQANRERMEDFCHALATVAAGPAAPLTTIEEATDYFCNNESGSVARYEVEEIDGKIVVWKLSGYLDNIWSAE